MPHQPNTASKPGSAEGIPHMWVWAPFVETYLQMGWMLSYAKPVGERGEFYSFIMEYPCTCRLPYLKKREW